MGGHQSRHVDVALRLESCLRVDLGLNDGWELGRLEGFLAPKTNYSPRYLNLYQLIN